jgi:transcriptional regulator with XRE-family HTH domain
MGTPMIESMGKTICSDYGTSGNCAGMTVGDRVKERRIAAGLSQSALARRVRLDPSTISGLESGDAKGSRYLHKIARALQTTPAYLSGETDDPETDSVDAPSMSVEECDWVELLRGMAKEDRRAMLRLARSLAARPAGETVHDSQHAYRGEG